MDEKLEKSLETMVEASIRNRSTDIAPLATLLPHEYKALAEYIVARCKTRIDSAIVAAQVDGYQQGYGDGFKAGRAAGWAEGVGI